MLVVIRIRRSVIKQFFLFVRLYGDDGLRWRLLLQQLLLKKAFLAQTLGVAALQFSQDEQEHHTPRLTRMCVELRAKVLGKYLQVDTVNWLACCYVRTADGQIQTTTAAKMQ